MISTLTGAAKRLTFSLLLAALLGGCAVYEPAAYDPYSHGPAAYSGTPYSYGPAAFPRTPYYVEPPVLLNFGFGFESSGRHHRDHGWRGEHGRRGEHGAGRGGEHGRRGEPGAGRGTQRRF